MDGTRHPVEVPPVGDALQLVLAGVLERETGAGDKVFDRGGDQHLGRTGHRADASPDVDGDTLDAFIGELDLAGVDARADLQAELSKRGADRKGAAHGSRRTVERRQETVAGGIDLDPFEPVELLACALMVLSQELYPSASPTIAARSVEPTMSVNRTVASRRSVDTC